MTVSQVISPKGLRTLKNTKTLKTNYTLMVKNAKKFNYLIKMYRQEKQAKVLAKRIKDLKKQAKNAGDFADNFKKGNWGNKTLGTKFTRTLNVITTALSIFGVALGFMNQQFSIEMSDIQIRQAELQARENGIQLKLIQRQNARLNNLEKKVNIIDRFATANGKLTGELQRNLVKIRENANNALYEARQGRKIVESKIEAVRKQAISINNDAKISIAKLQQKVNGINADYNTKIAKINQQIQQFAKTSTTDFQKAINAQISNFKTQIETANNRIKEANTEISKINNQIKNTPKTDNASIEKIANKSGAEAAKDAFDLLARSQLTVLDNKVQKVVVQQSFFEETNKVQSSALQNLAYNLGLLDIKIDKLGNRSIIPDFTPVNRKIDALEDKLVKFPQEFMKFENGIEQRITRAENTANNVQAKFNDITPQIRNIDARLGVQEKVNQEALPKLDETLLKLGLIPALVASAIKPSIPTVGDINNAVQTGNCKSLQTGCGKKANDDLAGVINGANQASNDALFSKLDKLLNAANTGQNAAQLALLNKIDNKLGNQIPDGGIGAKLNRIAEAFKLDKIVQLLTLATTLHNAAMLSNDIATTLSSAIGNALAVIGLKDDSGNPFDIGGILNASVQQIVIGVIGQENYFQLSQTWAKANRIYQSGMNIINSFQSLSNSILNGVEITAGRVGKVANALKSAGKVAENAYNFMNPQPKFNGILDKLEVIQNTASSIEQITQVPLEVTENLTQLQQANTEFIKAIKEDGEDKNKGINEPESDTLKQRQQLIKQASQGVLAPLSDFFNANE